MKLNAVKSLFLHPILKMRSRQMAFQENNRPILVYPVANNQLKFKSGVLLHKHIFVQFLQGNIKIFDFSTDLFNCCLMINVSFREMVWCSYLYMYIVYIHSLRTTSWKVGGHISIIFFVTCFFYLVNYLILTRGHFSIRCPHKAKDHFVFNTEDK